MPFRPPAVLQPKTNSASLAVRRGLPAPTDSAQKPRQSVKPTPFNFSLSRSQRAAAPQAPDPPIAEPASRKRPRETIQPKPFAFASDRRAAERMQ